jgi:protein-S-isoprenylcysteine O-methyltransferase Ste14
MAGGNTRSWCVSDWVGFICFGTLALITLSKMPAVGILLIPTLAFELFVAVSFLIREPLRAAVRSPRARLAAYGGSFLLLVFTHIAQRFYPHWLVLTELGAFRMMGAVLWITGSIWAAYSVWHLRSAFSIEPAARCLVTSGPYRVARHPLYTGYVAQYVGTWLFFPTIPLGIVLFGWFLLMADRIRHEERVLGSAFPEYADYRRRVGALGSVRLRRPARA